MQSSLKKSLYLGLAALSFGAVATVSTTASAKSYATAGAYSKLTIDATKRNVEATGTNALYTKPGTVKGAKVVASKATMAKLASSKKSADYFRAYGVKTTNRGSVYYRVVTMDQKYRGYVYGGKVADTFGGGIKAAETTTANTTDSTIGKTVTFTNPGTKNVTWTAPKYT
ncbi:S-layer protein, partial [Levilactobacillus namurensis]|nr:S-layer protein [Levilactobacillus namurensis]